jgi:hypothetical protein
MITINPENPCPLMSVPVYEKDKKIRRYTYKCVAHECIFYPKWFVKQIPPCQYVMLEGFEN